MSQTIYTEHEAAKPFNHRSEVSADAEYIVKKVVFHLWVIAVVVPLVLSVIYAVMTSK